METSLRLSRESKSLRIHAKQKFHHDSNTFLQAHGEIDTGNGNPSYFALIIRQFLPQLSTRIGVGLQSDKHRKLRYTIRGKKAFLLASSTDFALNIKGRCDLDQDFHKRKDSGGIELAWSKLNFQRDQDVRLKVGYELFEKVLIGSLLIMLGILMYGLVWLFISVCGITFLGFKLNIASNMAGALPATEGEQLDS